MSTARTFPINVTDNVAPKVTRKQINVCSFFVQLKKVVMIQSIQNMVVNI